VLAAAERWHREVVNEGKGRGRSRGGPVAAPARCASVRGVRKIYHLLGKVLGAAVDAGMIAQSPCQRVPLPKIEREEMRFLTPVEIARLADAIRPRYRALVLVGAYGGLRIGELAGLRRSRVDLLRGHGGGRRDRHRGSRPAPTPKR
jgi:integrase